VGFLVALEGIDGSGKGTQAGLLAERARADGRTVETFSFPTYDGNPFAEAVAGYLNGDFGSADEVHPELAALLYAADRFHARGALVEAIGEHDIVICDRYAASNAAHQGAKLQGEERERLLDWLERVEYGEFALPRPDLVVLFDTPVAVARTLVARKGERGYTTLAADIHEADTAHTTATREVYLELADRNDWRVVRTAGDGGELRDVDEIADEVWELVR
jgi:dTMP kinase